MDLTTATSPAMACRRLLLSAACSLVVAVTGLALPMAAPAQGAARSIVMASTT